jgi:putative transposase
MLKAYKYRLHPNKEQEEYFAKCFGCVRFVYNQMLNDRIKSYEKNKGLNINL